MDLKEATASRENVFDQDEVLHRSAYCQNLQLKELSNLLHHKTGKGAQVRLTEARTPQAIVELISAFKELGGDPSKLVQSAIERTL